MNENDVKTLADSIDQETWTLIRDAGTLYAAMQATGLDIDMQAAITCAAELVGLPKEYAYIVFLLA